MIRPSREGGGIGAACQETEQVPVGYDTPRKLIALVGVGLVIYGFLHLNLIFIGAGGAILGYLALGER